MGARSLDDILQNATPVGDEEAEAGTITEPATPRVRSLDEIIAGGKPVLSDERRTALQAAVDQTSADAINNDESSRIKLLETILGAADSVRGFARGFTGHGSELAIRGAQALAPELLGTAATNGFDAVRERSPVIAAGSELAGSVASPLGRMLGGAKGVGGLVAQGAKNGLIQGGTEAGFDAATRGEANTDDLITAAAGAIGGGIGEPVAAGVSKLGGAVAGALRAGAAKSKNLVAGATAADAKGIAQQYGRDAVPERLGELLDKYAAEPGFAGIGKSSQAHLKDSIIPALEAEGTKLKGLQGQVDNYLAQGTPDGGPLMPGAPGDIDKARETFLAKLQAEGSKNAGSPVEDESQYASALKRIVAAMRGTDGAAARTVDAVTPTNAPTFLDAAAMAARDADIAAAQAVDLSGGIPGAPYSARTTSDGVPMAAPKGSAPRGDNGKFMQATAAERMGAAVGYNKYNYPEGLTPGYGSTKTVPAAAPPDPIEDAAAKAVFQERQLLGLEPNGSVPYSKVVQPGTFGSEGTPLFENFPELVNAKSRFQSYAHSGPGGSVPEAASKQAAGFAGSVLRHEMLGLVDKMPSNLADAYKTSNDEFSKLAMLRDLMQKKAMGETTGGDFGSSLVGAGLGAGIGAASSLMTPGEDTGMMSMLGALGGAGSAFVSGATRSGLRQLGSVVTDTGANWARSLAGGTEGLTNTAARGIGKLGALSVGAAGAAKPLGHQRTQQVEQLLVLDPDGLGKYRQQLEQAKAAGNLSNEISKLEESDPVFRAMVSR